MAEQKVTYAISTDFQTGVDPTRLDMEIDASSIVAALARIETNGDVCDVTFATALSGPDQTALGMPPTPAGGTVIGDHDGSGLPDVREATFLASAASAGSTGTAVTVPIDSSVPDVGSSAAISPYSLASSEVTISEAGTYLIVAQATVEVSSAGTVQTQAEAFLELDAGGGYSEISGSKSRACFSGTVVNEPDAVAATLVARLDVDDKVRLRLNRIVGDATVRSAANQARLTIFALRPD